MARTHRCAVIVNIIVFVVVTVHWENIGLELWEDEKETVEKEQGKGRGKGAPHPEREIERAGVIAGIVPDAPGM